MKKKLYVYIAFIVIIVILIPISFSYLPSKLKEKKKNIYVEYINSILPNPYSEETKLVIGRENINRMSQAIKAYYKACNEKNSDFVKDILNLEYINYMDINVEKLISNNDGNTINANKLEINTIYEIGNNIYFAVINSSYETSYIGILLSEDDQKYSVIFDGIYNTDDIIKYEKEYDLEEHVDDET